LWSLPLEEPELHDGAAGSGVAQLGAGAGSDSGAAIAGSSTGAAGLAAAFFFLAFLAAFGAAFDFFGADFFAAFLADFFALFFAAFFADFFAAFFDGFLADFFISAISILEIELGARLIERKDAARGAVLRAWIDNHILARFENRILAVDTAVALRCAQLHVPNPRAERDALIAATALVHGLTIVTRNVGDFEPTGVPLINPWEQAAS